MPINRLHQHFVNTKILNPMTLDTFESRGIVFMAESDKLTTTADEDSYLQFDIRKIDIIYNPEYNLIQE